MSLELDNRVQWMAFGGGHSHFIPDVAKLLSTKNTCDGEAGRHAFVGKGLPEVRQLCDSLRPSDAGSARPGFAVQSVWILIAVPSGCRDLAGNSCVCRVGRIEVKSGLGECGRCCPACSNLRVPS